jgi:Ser/Thr protein kinase RdoA (MazF antagonist)
LDFFDGVPPVPPLTKRQLELVKQAIELLHSQNLVFGDLRVPNILIKDEGVMIIDFDWCGKAREARYPATLNDAVDWPEGVGPDAVMLKKHDLSM